MGRPGPRPGGRNLSRRSSKEINSGTMRAHCNVRTARTARCSNCTNPAVLCAHVLLHSVILPKRFFPQWEQCWVFDIKSGYCKVQNSLTKKSLKDCMEKCYIPEPGGCSISSEAFRRQISRLKYWTARRSRVKQDIGRVAMGQYSFWAILSW